MNVKDAEAYIRLQRLRKTSEERAATGDRPGDRPVTDQPRSWAESSGFTRGVEPVSAPISG